MKELLVIIAKKLVDHPEQVDVQQVEQDGVVKYSLIVSEEDKGKIIGKQGKIIKAIRSVVSAAGAIQGKKTMVEV